MIYRSFLEKRTKSMGRCDTPHTPNAAQVWNAASATNRGNLKPHSFHSFARQISSRFSQVSFHLLRPGNLLALRRLRYFYSGKIFPRTPFYSPNSNFPISIISNTCYLYNDVPGRYFYPGRCIFKYSAVKQPLLSNLFSCFPVRLLKQLTGMH